MARWLARQGWSVRVADTRDAAAAARQPCSATCRRPSSIAANSPRPCWPMSNSSRSLPGCHRRIAAAPLLKEARARGLELVGEIELFARELARLRQERAYAPRVLGVTGTNGKTTTTRLTGLLVERCGRARGRRRQHRPGGTRRTDGATRCRRSSGRLGARAVELPAADDHESRLRCRRGAQRDAGSPRLARLDGGVRQGEGTHLRAGHRARAEPRRSGRRGDDRAQGDGGHLRLRCTVATRGVRPGPRRRHDLACVGRGHEPADTAAQGGRRPARRAAPRSTCIG